jgi:hypothetical protein
MQVNHFSKKKIGLGAVFFSLAWLTQANVYAQSDDEILESVRACQNIAGLSLRLACYDRVLPPAVESLEGGSPRAVPRIENRPAVSNRGASGRSREELEETVAELEEQLEREAIDASNTARIIEVQRPSVRTSRLIAEDGRIFVESVNTSIIRWPETPFNVQINRSITGTITLRAIGVDGDRGLGRGIRVAQER